ncbi:hypothetical protein KNE206_44410 [Kitasatospora sp. NE20-6]|uniref:hypothetical protein n=1 Tax=Kitasatospora sp. NE20-6 TaxID=2859066 RepID=UPI0034DC182E
MATSSAVIRPIESPNSATPLNLQHDVVVLPREVSDSGVGVYHDSVIDLVKALRAENVDADFAHAKDERQWLGEKSATQHLIEVAVGIASNAGWAGISAVFRRRHSQGTVRLKLVRRINGPVGVTEEWFEVEGTGADVADALDRFNQSHLPELPE